MVIVLSELNNLHILNRLGVYPDSYYLDFDAFKNMVTVASEADIIIILSGTCRFSKKHTVDVIKSLLVRQGNKNDTGVKRVTVFSDYTLETMPEYYFYTHDLADAVLCKKKLAFEDEESIWDKLKTERKESIIVPQEPKKHFTSDSNTIEDRLLPLIKRAKVR